MQQFNRIIFYTAVILSFVSCSPKKPTVRTDAAQWNRTTLTASYESVGHKSDKWDKDAEDALKNYADVRSAHDADDADISMQLTGDAAESAISVGCDDPMIHYLYVRYAPSAKTNSFRARQDMYRSAAKDLEGSDYPAIRKFYANVDAAEMLWQQRNTNLWREVRGFRYLAMTNLSEALQDKTIPEMEAYKAAETLFQMLDRNTHELTNAYNTIEDSLFANDSKSSTAYLIKADFYLMYAWRGRGNGTASQVTEEGWRMFRERLAVAEKALDEAWSLNSRDENIPTLMISIIEGQQKDRKEMEKWFQRAMKLNPNNYEACRAKLHYLLPQWYGSRDDMLEFGHECAESIVWGGKIPLILVDAHSEFARTLDRSTRADYWLASDVWPDIKTGYEKYAQLNPNASLFRYPYAAYAFRCGQFDVFNEQIALIRKNDGKLNHNYFGGKDAFEKLVAIANGQNQLTNSPTN